MKNEMDGLLKCVLAPSVEPKAELNQKVLGIIKENEYMKKEKRYRKRRFSVAVLTAVLVFAFGSVTVMAAYHYLSADKVAAELQDEGLEHAYRGEEAVLMQETQECGEYYVSLLGSVAGENLSKNLSGEINGIEEDRMYTVVAIEKKDGTPMPDTSSDEYGSFPFFVSHYVKGLDPQKYNAVSMGGGYQEFVSEGILYRILDTENVEIFADKGIYVGVNSGTFYAADAYIYDENAGIMMPNEEFDGVNALFVLPFPKEKADPVAAQKYLEEFEIPEETPDETDMMIDMDVEEFIHKITSQNLDNYMKPVEGTKQICKPDEDGMFPYSWDTEDGSGNGMDAVDNLFPEKIAGTRAIGGFSYSEGGLRSMTLTVFTLNGDGTVTFEVYQPIF